MRLLFFTLVLIFNFLTAATILGQDFEREIPMSSDGIVEIVNRMGRVEAGVIAPTFDVNGEKVSSSGKLLLKISSNVAVADKDLKIDSNGGRIRIEIQPQAKNRRIDVSLLVPERIGLKIETSAGEANVSGNFREIEIKTDSGTIAVDVPAANLKYGLYWTGSRPRFLADFDLEKVQEKSGGRFEIKGKKVDENPEKETSVELKLTTEIGIIVLNVPANEVMSDLRVRPLTTAAKAIIRSGDSALMAAIRRASPKYFGDYARTLPPLKREPKLIEQANASEVLAETTKRAVVRVTDINNRAVGNLSAADFEVFESGNRIDIISVEPSTAAVNLVLLLDVSGSVDNYVNFIRKAARSFVNTVDKTDRISIVLFNNDVHVLSGFTSDKNSLSTSLDTFDAGGATAYYDSLAYTLTETLRPLKGERTAIVILTDGDDNRSFLPFDSLLGSIQESGVLIYPLYIPSSLIAASEANNLAAGLDPLRAKFTGLTTKAEGEGEKLAKVSGGVYYSIRQLSEIQAAYDDIAKQLRTAYLVTFGSKTAALADNRPSPRLKIKVKKDKLFVSTTSVSAVR